MIRLLSFAYRDGAPQAAVIRRVVDCRHLPNPHFVSGMRDLDGRDPRVQEFVANSGGAQMVADLVDRVDDGEFVALGCYGGVHRSVAVVELLAHELRTRGYEVEVRHGALG